MRWRQFLEEAPHGPAVRWRSVAALGLVCGAAVGGSAMLVAYASSGRWSLTAALQPLILLVLALVVIVELQYHAALTPQARLRIRFRLGRCLVAVSLLAASFALARYDHQARIQRHRHDRELESALRELTGGEVSVSSDGVFIHRVGPTFSNEQLQQLVRVVERNRDDCNLTLLDLSGSQVNDRGLFALDSCSRLAFLFLDGAPVSTSALLSLRNLHQLKILNAPHVAVTSAERSKLQRMFPAARVSVADK